MKRVRLKDQWGVLHDCRSKEFGASINRDHARYCLKLFRNWNLLRCTSRCRVVKIERWAIVPETKRRKEAGR